MIALSQVSRSEVGWISAAHPPNERRMRCAYPPYKNSENIPSEFA